jgi:hypothetical protein
MTWITTLARYAPEDQAQILWSVRRGVGSLCAASLLNAANASADRVLGAIRDAEQDLGDGLRRLATSADTNPRVASAIDPLRTAVPYRLQASAKANDAVRPSVRATIDAALAEARRASDAIAQNHAIDEVITRLQSARAALAALTASVNALLV